MPFGILILSFKILKRGKGASKRKRCWKLLDEGGSQVNIWEWNGRTLSTPRMR